MGKFLKFIILFIVLIFGMQFCIQADMGVPSINKYTAKVTNPDGASYKSDAQGMTGKLEYGDEIEVEFDYQDNAGIRYAAFKMDEDKYAYSYVNIDDIEPVEEMYVSDKLNLDKKIDRVVIAENGIKIHKGPAYDYETLDIVIPYGTEIECYQEKNSTENPWFYVSYNGTEGWVCELNSLGTYVEGEYVLARDTDLYMLNEKNEYNILDNVKANTVIKNPILTDPWSQSYLIKYNDKWGYIEDRAFIEEIIEANVYKTTKDVKIYHSSSVDIEKTEEIAEIPKGTEYVIKYMDFYGMCSFISVNGNQGWIYENDYGEKIENIDVSKYETPTFENFTVCETPKLEKKDSNENDEKVENNVTNEYNMTIEKVNNYEKNDITPNQIITFGVVGAIVISLTCVVTIILINKTTKKDKNVNKEKSEETKKEEK